MLWYVLIGIGCFLLGGATMEATWTEFDAPWHKKPGFYDTGVYLDAPEDRPR